MFNPARLGRREPHLRRSPPAASSKRIWLTLQRDLYRPKIRPVFRSSDEIFEAAMRIPGAIYRPATKSMDTFRPGLRVVTPISSLELIGRCRDDDSGPAR